MTFCNFSKSRLLVFVSFLCFVLAKRRSYNDQPKIYSVDGHLHFQVPKEKSVKFLAEGLTINDMDVLETLNTAHNATKLLNAYKTTLSTFNNQVEDLEIRLAGLPRNGTIGNTTTVIPSNINIRLNRLNRRINGLQSRLLAFLSLLTHNECSKNPCKNGGTCSDIFNGFLCQCQNGWEGHTCENDVNECARFAGTDLGCQNGATCVNKPGTYECLCQNGWLGLHCTRKTADCSTGGFELCGHGTCIPQNTPAGYKCICDQGWTTDGVRMACTVDVDECKQNHPPCSTNPLVACINVPGSFYCQHCPPGYTGNGYYCADINECELAFNGGCSMNPKVECINTPGSSKCASCPPGYQGDGKICSYQGVCKVNNGGCNILARCQDNPNIGDSFVQCICPPGYIGNGIGTRGCIANPSYQPTCDPNPCVHGTCVPTGNSYKCICQTRYYGTHCEHQGNPCDSNPCMNGGTCQNLSGTFTCTCLEGFEGERCESQEDACGGTIYKTNGTLKYPVDDFVSRGSKKFSCAWVISTTKDMILNITFKKFQLNDEPCNSEFLQIHDGRSSVSHAFGRFCGNKAPLNGTFLSSHPVIYFWFKSNGRSLGKPELEISWTSQKPVCGGLIRDKQGVITSPGYPGMYPNNRDCLWTFLAPPTKRFYFHFSSLNIGNNRDCSKDSLKFLTLNPTLDGSGIIPICNSTMPSPFYVDYSVVRLHFHSDASKNYPGFQLAYKVVSGIPGCGGTYTTGSGVLKSVDITSDMPQLIECEYEIKLPKKSRIRLTFLEMTLGKLYPLSDGCDVAYVAIYKGTDTDNLIGKYCGTALPSPYIVYSQNLLVVSHLSKGKPGIWKMKYEIVCGDRFTEPSGSFMPGYSASRICTFEIERPPGNIIIADFTLNFMNSVNGTSGSYLEVRDGDTENSTLIGTYRGNQKIKIESSTNFLWIKIDRLIFERVQVNYTSTDVGCGGIIKQRLGTIQSPSHPTGEYPANQICRWVFVTPPGQVVQLNWMTFNLEKSHECTYDNIQIFDNATGDGRGADMGKFCGDIKPPVMLSSSNIMTVVFTSDNTVHGDGFLASYTFIKESKLCGGNYFTSAGQIRSPGYPDEYPTNKECEWTITVPPGMQIELNITDFNIEEYSNCRYDWLEIRNGGTSASPLIGKYCGTNIPKLIPSHTNKLHIKFVSDMSRSGHGFRITWSSASRGCGGLLTSPTGSIISPHYPEPYSTNTECFWRVTVSAGSKIQVVFADIELEKHNVCSLDYVELFDGATINSKALGKFCSAPVAPITTSGNSLLIRFRSDVSFQGRGFNLQYSTVCQNTLTGFRGAIESPNFPNDYPQDQSCTWDIVVSDRNKINITFSHFELERSTTGSGNATCRFDYVEIDYLEELNEVEETETYTKYDRFCGDKNPGLITINSHHARIHFVSDSLLLGAGFRLEWAIFGCGGILTHLEGGIQSPNYPKPYPASVECHWQIKVPLGKSIEITFKEIDVERDSGCNYDYVKIFNGEDKSYNLLAKFCHQTKPITLTSTGNAMFIQFKADYSYQGKGFVANYSTVDTTCGGVLSAPEGSIFSPNYPNNYKKNETCEWLIDTDENHVIELTFSDVDLISPPLAACDKNYVKVFDGPTQAYPALETVCGTKKPNETIVSTYNHMFVEFRSHHIFTSKGFMAKYKKSCGARIKTSGTGNIELSKDYDVSERNCSWIIEAEDPSKHIYLTISHISMEIYSWCTDEENYIFIYNGPFSDSPLIGSYCNKLPPLLVSDGSTIRIDVTTDIDFFATYSIFDDECGASLTSLEGFIASPGYPKKYPSNVQCEWTISSAPGNTMSLNFEHFNLPESEKCNTDYLEIKKHNSSGTLLGTFCGKNRPSNITHQGSIWMIFKTSALQSGEIAGGDVKGFYLQFKTNTENTLSGPKGTIANPLYPKGFREIGSDYTWTITVAPKNRILLTFSELFIGINQEEDNECSGTSLQVHDGSDYDAPLLRSICGSEIPKPILSSSNVVYIMAQYFTTRLGTIFKFDWEEVASQYQTESGNSTSELCERNSERWRGIDHFTGCSQSIFVNGTYELKSPGYPNGYAPNLNCEWILSTIPMNHLEISFTKIDLHRFAYSRVCATDVIIVYQRKDSSLDWQEITKVCEQPNDDLIVSGTNLMKVVFKTNNFLNRTGFLAEVTEECGGSLTGTSGYIIYNSTKFTAYNKGAYRCQWNITVRSGKTIQLSFEEFNLGINVSSGCNQYLLIRNGQFADSPFLGNGRYCGSEIPMRTPLKTTGNYMYLEYKGLSKINYKGFRLRYQEVGYQCGGEILLDQYHNSSEISSPNYPNIPPTHTECIWRVRVPPGENVRVDFEDRFDLTRSRFNNGCIIEYVELRDGGTDISPLISQNCGENVPNTMFSTDNIMYIKFFTDTDDPKNGFKAKVSIGFCGGTVRNTGELQSPAYDGFERTLNCTWYLKARSGQVLTINFTEINTRSSRNCSDDINKIVLTQYDQYFKNETTLGSYCGKKLPQSITSMTNEVRVHYIVNTAYTQSFKLEFSASVEECKGTFEQESGVITSPGYPYAQHPDRYCSWQIRVPKGRRITLHIDENDLETAVPYNFLAIFDGWRVGPKIAFLNQIHTGDTFESTDNTAHMIFWSQYASAKRGFKITFTSDRPSICNGDFNQTSGVITHPQTRNHPYYCEYEHYNVHKEETLALTLTVNTNSTYTGLGCRVRSTGIKITQANERLIKAICVTTTTPVIIRSPYIVTNVVAIRGPMFYLNYSLSYNTYHCGGRIKGETGSITSPNYPNKPSQTYECAWELSIDPGQTIKIRLVDLDLGDDCDKHFLSVYNGESVVHPRIGKFCKNNKPDEIITQTHRAFIEYRRAATENNGKGFNLTYEPVINGCGGIFHDRTRIIQTPNYGKGDYSENSECQWEIRSSPGNFIKLEFVGRFNLEDSDNCTKDFVEVWDWKNNAWISQGRYCGRQAPNEIKSTSTKMKILFRSNDKINGGGFKAQWDWHCGGTFEATQVPQYIVSPNYPEVYRSRLNCVYNITSKNIVNLKFLDFRLEEGGPNCQYDNVTVHGTLFGKQLRQLGVFCGNSTPPPFRIRKSINIVFKTDLSMFKNGEGFRIMFQDEICGGTITGPTDIRVPDLTQGHRFFQPELTCTWTVEAPKNQIAIFNLKKLTMSSFTIGATCMNQALQIYDMEIKSDKRILQACSIISDISVPSESNKMIIKLKSYPYNFKGMEAEVYFTYGPSQGCGGVINLTEPQTIRSPNNLKELDCKWKITAPTDYQVLINFTSIKIPGHCGDNLSKNFTYTCECAFVEVRDGGGPFSEQLAKLCSMDNNFSRSFTTMGNAGFVRLFSWGIHNNVFVMNLTPVKSKCGVSHLNVTENQQILTSPNYPNSYPDETKCVWVLKSPQSTRIFLNVEVFDLDDQTKDQNEIEDCDGEDRLEVIEDPNRSIITEGLGPNAVHASRRGAAHMNHLFKTYNRQQFCGKDDIPFHYYSAGNTLSLEFTSMASFHAKSKQKGFKLTYGIAGYDLNLTADNGRVSNYGTRKNKNSCIITITVPENKTISIYFTHFYSFPRNNCSDSGLMIKDKDSTGPVLINICGFKIPNPVFSKSNKLYIKVQGGNQLPTSYDFLYTSTDKGPGCGGYIYNYRGIITSPLYPNELKPSYTNDLECTWEIRVPIGHEISLKFNEFDIQGNCAKTKVVVTTYSEFDSLDHTFCAQDHPATLTSERHITVTYYSSVNNGGLGWKASFEGVKNETTNTDIVPISNPYNAPILRIG